jgi:hypothetical protein
MVKRKLYNNLFVIISLFFIFPILLYFFNQLLVFFIYFVIVFFFNGIKNYKLKNNLNLETFYITLKSTKSMIYFLIAFCTLTNLIIPDYQLETKYTLISTFVIIVSFFEGIIGHYDLKKEKNSI